LTKKGLSDGVVWSRGKKKGDHFQGLTSLEGKRVGNPPPIKNILQGLRVTEVRLEKESFSILTPKKKKKKWSFRKGCSIRQKG